MKFPNTLKSFSWILLLGLILSACNDKVSPNGFSIDGRDKDYQSVADSVELGAKTISIDRIYSRSTYTLLGQLNDAYFGDFRASYICRMQNAPTFHFQHTPINEEIDSVAIELNYASMVGDPSVWSKAVVYEVTEKLPNSYLSTDLAPYVKGAKKLGTIAYQAKAGEESHRIQIPISKELGQRFYTASKEHPEYFENQSSFEDHLLKGIYVQSTTGSGAIISIYNTSLLIYYSHETMEEDKKDGQMKKVKKPSLIRFTNTNQLGLIQKFENNRRKELLDANSKEFGYITSPQGLALQLTISPKELNKIFSKKLGESKRKRMINAAYLSLKVNVPPTDKTELNPSLYTLLLPKDSISNFFQKGYTEQTQANTTFLSSAYNINNRTYIFPNISNLLSRHIEEHGTIGSDGNWDIKEALEIVVLPVRRETQPNSNNSVTTDLMNYIYPSAARIQLQNGKIKMGVIASSNLPIEDRK